MENENGSNNGNLQEYKTVVVTDLLSDFMTIQAEAAERYGVQGKLSVTGTYFTSLVSTLINEAIASNIGENGLLTPDTKLIAFEDMHVLRNIMRDSLATGIETGIHTALPNRHPEVIVIIECDDPTLPDDDPTKC